MNYLISERKGATLSEIARALDEPKSSMHDLLATAVHMNYIRKNNKHFYIGSQAKKAGKAYTERQEILDIVSPVLIEASKAFHTSVSFVLLEKNVLNYAFTVHPDDAVLVARADCPINLIHASGSGKVLLAHSTASHRNKLISTLDFYKFTDKTITNRINFLNELEKVRKQGFGVDDREYSYLLQCIAAPIIKEESVIAAVSFSSLNLFIGEPDEQAQHVITVAKKISELLR